jgi:hypothetical protein
MRLTLVSCAVLCLMAGCSFSPPKPPQCQGEFRPINVSTQPTAALPMSRKDRLALCTKRSRYADQG